MIDLIDNIELTRRQMLATSAFLAAPTLDKWSKRADYNYLLADVSGREVVLPTGKYMPFDWSVKEIGVDTEGVKLSWQPTVLTKNATLTLRITSATDVREVVILTVKTAVSHKKIASWDIRFAHYMQPFELEMPKEFEALILAEGLVLERETGTKPFWFFTKNEPSREINFPLNDSKTASYAGKTNAPTAFLPHLLVSEKPKKDAWKDRLLSLESIQTFGWMQGVVWDGLLEMSNTSKRAKTALTQQLDLYFKENSLVYANLNNIKSVENISTVESILPFAILAQTNPTHNLLKTAVEFCEKHANRGGVIADGTGSNRTVKTEECYTVSYPLAVLAKTLNRPELAVLALKTLQSRVLLLEKDNSIYQRGTEEGTLYFENWARGVAWYLLGLVKTLVHLPESEGKEAVKLSLKKSVEKVLAYQQPNGLWYCFFHKSETGFETSGTAGIAAALSYGFQHKLLKNTAEIAALKAQKGLIPYLTPDGFLTGTAQVNKGGDTLQQNGFRVISPYTLGFLAHFKTKRK